MKKKNLIGFVTLKAKDNISLEIVRGKIEKEIKSITEKSMFGFKVANIVDLKYSFEEHEDKLTINLSLGTDLFLITDQVFLSLINSHLNPNKEMNQYIDLVDYNLRLITNAYNYQLFFDGKSWQTRS